MNQISPSLSLGSSTAVKPLGNSAGSNAGEVHAQAFDPVGRPASFAQHLTAAPELVSGGSEFGFVLVEELAGGKTLPVVAGSELPAEQLGTSPQAAPDLFQLVEGALPPAVLASELQAAQRAKLAGGSAGAGQIATLPHRFGRTDPVAAQASPASPAVKPASPETAAGTASLSAPAIAPSVGLGSSTQPPAPGARHHPAMTGEQIAGEDQSMLLRAPTLPTAQLLRANESLCAPDGAETVLAARQAAPAGDMAEAMPDAEPTPNGPPGLVARIVASDPRSKTLLAPSAEPEMAGGSQLVIASPPAGSQPIAPASAPAALTLNAQPTQTFDLASVIDRLVEARQSAAGDTLQVSVAHREFGSIGIRFEHAAGATLTGFALTSSDPSFAPAVQAALADRAGADRQPGPSEQTAQARPEQSATRGDTGGQSGQHPAQAQPQDDQPNPARARRFDDAAGVGRSAEGDAQSAGSAGARGLYA